MDTNSDTQVRHPISTVLIVEDDDNARRLIRLFIESEGYRILTASKAEEAFDLIAQHSVQLVLLDVMLPGMNGFEILYVIRQKYNQIELPVIMVTALDQKDDVVGALELGANDYLVKPYDIDVLKARIKTQIKQSSCFSQGSSFIQPDHQLLESRYQLQKVLSWGGFGIVYLACDLQRPGSPQCIVKKLSLVSDPEENLYSFSQRLEYARELFRREAEVLEALGHHPRIPQLLAYFSRNNELYLVEEFIPGQTLREIIKTKDFWKTSEIISLLVDLLTTLGFIHQCQIIHRDLKPENIICQSKDNGSIEYYLIDFGAVRQLQAYSRSGFVGTEGYAPPEQYIGHPDFNSDIYALGKVVMEMIGYPKRELGIFTHLLIKMTMEASKSRYQTTKEVLLDIEDLSKNLAACQIEPCQNSQPDPVQELIPI